jgi:RNA polymerase sigma-70 factor (ECF subfamily)
VIDDLTPEELRDDRAWRQLERRLRPFVARRVGTSDIDDVLQDIFLRIHRGLPSIRDDQRFAPWIYQIARNALADHGRTRARQPPMADDALELADDPREADDGAVQREVAGHAAAFVAALPSPYREALTLTELEGVTQREAADILGLSVSGMKSRVQRGRQKLRTALEGCCRIALDSRRRVVECEPRRDAGHSNRCCQ